MAPIVIVGAGLAGATVAGSLRDRGFDGEIVLVGDEPLPPYERPPLSKEYLRGEGDLALVRPQAWYADHGVDARFGVRAERLDLPARALELADGGRVAFDRLVIATGSRNRRLDRPGVDLPGVFGLRTAADAEAIREAARRARHAVLVGMGFIGAEVGASLRSLGLDVTIVEALGAPLERVLGAELGGAIEGLHRDHGVRMVFGDGVDRFEGDGRFEALVTERGRRIEGDLAVVGVGVEPVTDLAEAAGVAVDRGIPVDAALRTAVEGVWAVGDVARHDHPVFGPIRVEHFDNALKMGDHVAGNLLGPAEPFRDAHWFWSDQYDANLEMAGFATSWDQTVIRGSLGERSFVAFLLDRGRLASTFSMNWKRDVRRSMPLIEAGARPDPGLLSDPDVDLRRLRPPSEEP